MDNCRGCGAPLKSHVCGYCGNEYPELVKLSFRKELDVADAAYRAMFNYGVSDPRLMFGTEFTECTCAETAKEGFRMCDVHQIGL